MCRKRLGDIVGHKLSMSHQCHDTVKKATLHENIGINSSE